MIGIDFFDNLHAAGLGFRMVDDPAVRAGYVVPLITVGQAALCAYADQPIDGKIATMIKAHKPALRAFVAGYAVAELQRAGRLTDEDGTLLARFVVDADLIDFLLTSEARP